MKLSSNQKTSLKRVAKIHKIKLILLFGSQVNKKNHQMSDLDIGILSEKNSEKNNLNFKEFTEILMALREILPAQPTQETQQIDLVVINHADPLFLKKILENAKLLYGKKKDFLNLKLYSFHRYLDYQKYLDLEEKFCHRFIIKNNKIK